MKEILKEWKKTYWDDENYDKPIEKPSKELAEAWLDAQIEYNKKFNDFVRELRDEYEFPLFGGDLHYGGFDHEYEIEQTGHYDKHDHVMIYKGMDTLADILGVELKEQKGWNDEYPFSYTFMYKGTMVQSIEKVPLPGFGDRRADG